MRKIWFRGKRIDNGEWVEGYLVKLPSAIQIGSDYSPWYIIVPPVDPDDDGGRYNVDPDTVGQYTGLTVPSGKIFEHDIVTAKFKSNGARFNFTVQYSNEKGCYVFDNGRIKVPFCEIRSVRIIGNTHDNHELLEGGE